MPAFVSPAHESNVTSSSVSIPLSDPWVIDISAYYGLFGAERATIVASLGFWDH